MNLVLFSPSRSLSLSHLCLLPVADFLLKQPPAMVEPVLALTAAPRAF